MSVTTGTSSGGPMRGSEGGPKRARESADLSRLANIALRVGTIAALMDGAGAVQSELNAWRALLDACLARVRDELDEGSHEGESLSSGFVL